MGLKNAAAICLISLFSAGLVVLIARSLDLQAASRLEPQLERIAAELQAIREGGAVAATDEGMAAVDDGLMVYYFHGNQRCPTCRSIESQSHETVQSCFAPQLDRGEVVWRILNHEKPAVASWKEKFEIQMPVVVLARMKNGQIDDWKRLDRVWALVDDQPAFADYVRNEIHQMLAEADSDVPSGDVPEIPIPDVEPTDIPIPGQEEMN